MLDPFSPLSAKDKEHAVELIKDVHEQFHQRGAGRTRQSA